MAANVSDLGLAVVRPTRRMISTCSASTRESACRQGHVSEAARSGVDGVCLVRALGERPAERVDAMREALARGRREPRAPVPLLPHPSLANGL